MTALGSVLIVEDDSALRQSLRETLEEAGFCPGEASSGEEAILALRHSQFETILLDINMPGIGGMAACRRIRQTYPLLPILVLTVRDEEKDKIEALDVAVSLAISLPVQLTQKRVALELADDAFVMKGHVHPSTDVIPSRDLFRRNPQHRHQLGSTHVGQPV